MASTAGISGSHTQQTCARTRGGTVCRLGEGEKERIQHCETRLWRTRPLISLALRSRGSTQGTQTVALRGRTLNGAPRPHTGATRRGLTSLPGARRRLDELRKARGVLTEARSRCRAPARSLRKVAAVCNCTRQSLEAPPRANGRRHVGGPRWGHVGVRVRCRPVRAAVAKMASMRESDTGLWLHNKLGATDELWAPPSIASLLTAAVIDNIRLCFHRLSSAVKLKLLLGTLHLPRRTVDEVRARAGFAPAGAPLLPAASICAVPCPSPAGREHLRVGAAWPPQVARTP